MVAADLLLFFMLLAAIALVFSPRLIHSLIALTTFSSLLTIQYVCLKAPDVAITEAALGAGLSTLVYLTAIRKTASMPQATTPGDERIHPETMQEHTMIELAEYIESGHLHLLNGRKRGPIIQEILQHCLYDHDPTFAQAVIHHVLTARRGASPLDMELGRGFALVHARHNDCPDVRLTIGLLPEPRKLYKGEPIHTVIGIVLPSSQSRQYLAFLARFGRLIYSQESVDAFKEAGRLHATGETEKAQRMLLAYIHSFEEA